MEFEDILKFVWGAIILVFFVVSRFKINKNNEQQEQPEYEDESQEGESPQRRGRAMPFDLEQLFGEVKSSTPAPKPTSAPQRVEVKQPVSPITKNEISDKKISKSVDFNLRKAVIMTEILTPKFKNE